MLSTPTCIAYTIVGYLYFIYNMNDYLAGILKHQDDNLSHVIQLGSRVQEVNGRHPLAVCLLLQDETSELLFIARRNFQP